MVDVFQGHEWADPFGHGVDPEGAWSDLDLEGWYFAEKDDRGTYEGDPVGPFPTEQAATTEWMRRQDFDPSEVREALISAHRAGRLRVGW